ncbi:MAG: hypothetical protein OXN79_09990 [bacterium]|nr:hypothetical protein [bacterium]
MRGKMDASEFKEYILGALFLKRAGLKLTAGLNVDGLGITRYPHLSRPRNRPCFGKRPGLRLCGGSEGDREVAMAVVRQLLGGYRGRVCFGAASARRRGGKRLLLRPGSRGRRRGRRGWGGGLGSR